jgi:hypothetical protein
MYLNNIKIEKPIGRCFFIMAPSFSSPIHTRGITELASSYLLNRSIGSLPPLLSSAQASCAFSTDDTGSSSIYCASFSCLIHSLGPLSSFATTWAPLTSAAPVAPQRYYCRTIENHALLGAIDEITHRAKDKA